MDVISSTLPNWRLRFSFDDSHQGPLFTGYTSPSPSYQRLDRLDWKPFYRRHRAVRTDLYFLRYPSRESLVDTWFERFIESGEMPRPTCVVVLERTFSILHNQGGLHRARRKRFQRAGYTCYLKYLPSHAAGAPLWGGHFWSFFALHDPARVLPFQQAPLGDPSAPYRASSPCLYEHKVRRWIPESQLLPADQTLHPNHLGQCRGRPVFATDLPLPANPSLLVRGIHGVRGLTGEEWLKLKGLPATWKPPWKILQGLILLPSAPEWATIGRACHELLAQTLQESPGPTNDLPGCGTPGPTPETTSENHPEWHWEAPDLTPGGAFHTARLDTLRRVVGRLNGPETWVNEGRETLARHSTNYGPSGPNDLVILWWEWPEEHWVELREGASMNFLHLPPAGLVENSDLQGEELAAAVEFVDELCELRVLVPPTRPLRNNLPVFTVDKPEQPGQKRPIADGKRGGQNACCAADPVFLPTPDDILVFLYRGGWSGTLDCSKFFHMFATREDERHLMGMLHPSTNAPLWYQRLPMGTRNSPAASGRFGASFLRRIRQHPLFRGTERDNTFVQRLRSQPYQEGVGTGRIQIGSDGLPVCLIWIHVDDLFIHGPTFTKTSAAMRYVMDETVRVGLICQPRKIMPPAQVRKYCGFLYDTTGVPCRKLPAAKVTKAIALITFLESNRDGAISRLALAVVVGTLQSLVPATQSNVGAAYLRSLYYVLARDVNPQFQGTAQAYHDRITMTDDAWSELQWWHQGLLDTFSRRLTTQEDGFFVLAAGDGSGTGAGGTLRFVEGSEDATLTDLWQGIWQGPGKMMTSNWKELRTALEVLLHEPLHTSRLRQRRVFYFTDNEVSYNIIRRGSSTSAPLHALVRAIKGLELRHDCIFECIHIPGTVMISEGSDGLSRGLVPSAANWNFDFAFGDLFRALTPTPDHLHAVTSLFPPGVMLPATIICPPDPWLRLPMVDRSYVWMLEPHTARQAIGIALQGWIESPWSSQHVFVVPRICQRTFGRVHKQVRFVGSFILTTYPLPFLVFHLPPFTRTLPPDPGMELPPNPRAPWWVRQQVAALRRVSSALP